MRTWELPKTAEPWSLTSLREKLIKIGAKVSATAATSLQMAEVAVSRQMFAEVLSVISRLRAPPAPARGSGVTCGKRRGARYALMQARRRVLAFRCVNRRFRPPPARAAPDLLLLKLIKGR
jgi:hypothetical protein